MHSAFCDWQTAKHHSFAPPPFASLAHVQDVFKALGGAALVVGGAVRDWQCGVPIGDVDVATPLIPEQVMALAHAAGLGVHPTGLEHGTVTLVSNKQAVEVTSLRSDVSTDGRRATVAFTSSLRADAARRDFTLNGMYADLEGTVYDFFGGLEDAKAGRVRFIGNARERIAEDYLRILRFFRFAARFADFPLDVTALEAIAQGRHGLATLSKQRVRQEMLKLLFAPAAPQVLRQMHGLGLFCLLSSLPPCISRFERVHQRLAGSGMFDEAAALGALFVQHQGSLAALDRDFVLSRGERADLEALCKAYVHSAMAVERRVYCFGNKAVMQALALWAPPEQFAQQNGRAQSFKAPVFPVSGNDLIARGLSPGPALGAALKALESYWLDQGFAPSKQALLADLP